MVIGAVIGGIAIGNIAVLIIIMIAIVLLAKRIKKRYELYRHNSQMSIPDIESKMCTLVSHT